MRGRKKSHTLRDKLTLVPNSAEWPFREISGDGDSRREDELLVLFPLPWPLGVSDRQIQQGFDLN